MEQEKNIDLRIEKLNTKIERIEKITKGVKVGFYTPSILIGIGSISMFKECFVEKIFEQVRNNQEVVDEMQNQVVDFSFATILNVML